MIFSTKVRRSGSPEVRKSLQGIAGSSPRTRFEAVFDFRTSGLPDFRTVAFLTLLAAALPALDGPLGPPQRAVAHPDGWSLRWSPELPAGTHRLQLPPWCTPQVLGGAGSWRIETIPGDPGPLPEALAALIERRNAWAAQRAAATDAQAVAAAAERHWRTRLPAHAARQAPDPSWQGGLDAVIAARAAADDAATAVERERAELIAAAVAHAGDEPAAIRLLLLDQTLPDGDVLDRLGMSGQWAARPAPGARVLVLELAAPARVQLAADAAGGWSASSTATLAGATVRLERLATLRRDAGADWGSPAVAVTTALRHPPLPGPTPRPVRLVADAVADAVSSAVQTRSVAAVDGIAMASTAAEPPPVRTAPISPPAKPVAGEAAGAAEPAIDPFAAEAGAVALGPAATSVLVPLGSATLPVLADAVVVAPAVCPIAVRRVRVALDGRPLPAGPVLVGDGAGGVRSGRLPDLAPGERIDLVVAELPQVFVMTSSVWNVDPTQQTAKRQRHGIDHWIVNAGDAPLAVEVLLAAPQTTAKDIALTLDPATTPGGTDAGPGLRRWAATIAPGNPQRYGIGWTITASGGAKL